MQRLGFGLFVVGVIISSWYAARFIPPSSIHGSGAEGAITSMDRLEAWGSLAGAPFGAGAVLMIVGGVISRRATAKHVRSHAIASADGGDTHTMLRDIGTAVAALPAGNPQGHATALRGQLDVLLDEKIPAFLEARQHHELNLGPVGYAELSSAFAGTERNLARAWSALADEAWDEVSPCIESAKEFIVEAVRLAGRHRA